MSGIINLTSIVIFRSQTKRNAIDVVIEFEYQENEMPKILNLKRNLKKTTLCLEGAG